MATRPSFTKMWNTFATIYADGTVASVGAMIEGKVGENIELGIRDAEKGFTNACAIRMSYALNYSGAPIIRGSWSTVSGGDKKWYIYRVKDLVPYLKSQFGKPDKTIKMPKPSDFAGLRGVLVFDGNWRDASGHATLWDGVSCSDHCYFPLATEASIWLLK